MGFSNCRYNTEKIAEALGVSEQALIDAMNENAFGGMIRVWSVEDKGKYSTARISISKKNKDTETYTTEFSDGFVRLVGQAHNVFKNVVIDEKKGVSARIINCDVTNVYTTPDGKVNYTPNWTIFAVELFDGNTNTNNKGKSNANSAKPTSGKDDFMNIPEGVDDEELPFE